MSESEIIYTSATGDPKMDVAVKNAQETFKYFWREMSWENRRIVPAHNLNSIKVGFETDAGEDVPELEHMWVSDISFDGKEICGTLLNQPNWVSNLNSGDSITIELPQVTDWMYAIGGKVYGGYTINAMRSEMDRVERIAHDKAWGLNFGSPDCVEVCHKQPAKKSLLNLFKKPVLPTDEEMMSKDHPMCINMEPKIREQLEMSKGVLDFKDESGNSMLHMEALAGNELSVKLLLDYGADKTATNNHGQTPKDLARLMKWNSIEALLK